MKKDKIVPRGKDGQHFAGVHYSMDGEQTLTATVVRTARCPKPLHNIALSSIRAFAMAIARSGMGEIISVDGKNVKESGK